MVEQLQLCIQKDSGDEKYMEVELWLHFTQFEGLRWLYVSVFFNAQHQQSILQMSVDSLHA